MELLKQQSKTNLLNHKSLMIQLSSKQLLGDISSKSLLDMGLMSNASNADLTTKQEHLRSTEQKIKETWKDISKYRDYTFYYLPDKTKDIICLKNQIMLIELLAGRKDLEERIAVIEDFKS